MPHKSSFWSHFLLCGLLCSGLIRSLSAEELPRKLAFLVGVSSYDKANLRNLSYAESDMKALGEELKKSGFTVTMMLGSAVGEQRATRANLRAKLETEFLNSVSQLSKKDIVLLAFSGHGMQFVVRRNDMPVEDSFFCPVDALASDSDTMLSFSDMMERLAAKSGAENNLLIIDACRDNPGKGVSKGLDGSRVTQLPANLAVVFSSSAGTQSYEAENLRHGIFTYYLLDGLRGKAKDFDGEVTWGTLVNYVKKQVDRNSVTLVGRSQRPNDISNLQGAPPVLVAAASSSAFRSATSGMEFALIPAGDFIMGSPADETSTTSGGVTTSPLSSEAQHRVKITKPFYLGKFEVTQREWENVMGTQPSFYSYDSMKSFYKIDNVDGYTSDKLMLSFPGNRYRELQQVYTADSPAHFPVERVSWYDVAEFCNRLSLRDGLTPYFRLNNIRKEGGSIKYAEVEFLKGDGYRLPTEAEWEYACRAGTKTAFHFGASSHGLESNIRGMDELGGATDGVNRTLGISPAGAAVRAVRIGRTTKVGSYAPNGFGLYDMHGNVSEWCLDAYVPHLANLLLEDPFIQSGEQRVTRGGSFDYNADRSRSAARSSLEPEQVSSSVGFRIARSAVK